MNKEILNEINRFREIAGLTLLNEASIGGGWIDELLTVLGKNSEQLDTFIKNSDDVLAAEIRTNIDDVASRLGRPVDEILERIKLKTLATDEADEILKTLLKSTNKEVKDTDINTIKSKLNMLTEKPILDIYFSELFTNTFPQFQNPII